MLLRFLALTTCLNYGSTAPTEQKTLIVEAVEDATIGGVAPKAKGRALQGRFLHITGKSCL